MSDSAWRKKLQKASFRGVPFNVKSAATEVGRRTVLHEYPQRDNAGSEDMGRRARVWDIEAIVIGDDYFVARDKLIAALEEKGPGELVHPFYGRKQVSLLGPVRISESFDEGGLARFPLQFVEDDGTALSPTTRMDTQSKVASAADAAKSAVSADFAKTFSVAGKPEFVADAALTVARDAMKALDGVRNGMIPDLSVASAYITAAQGVVAGLANLIRSPVGFASNVTGLISGFTGLADSPISAVTALKDLFGYGNKGSGKLASMAPLQSVPTTTPSRVQQATNQAATVSLVQRTAVIEATRTASTMDFESYDQAATLRDTLADALDSQAETASDEVYQALTDLRAALVRDVATRAADLARVATVTMPSTLPALVVAYRVYGDATRDADIIARNPRLIRHPGFVPGGEALEILLDQ